MSQSKRLKGYIKTFQVGDRVTVTRGRCKGYSGEVTEVWPDEKRATVKLPRSARWYNYDSDYGFGSLIKSNDWQWLLTAKERTINGNRTDRRAVPGI